MKILIVVTLISLASLSFAQDTTIKGVNYKVIQIELTGVEFHEDGSDNILYPSYTIKTGAGEKVIRVPEGINRPHSIEILPGIYTIEYLFDGKQKELTLEVGNSCFQHFRLK